MEEDGRPGRSVADNSTTQQESGVEMAERYRERCAEERERERERERGAISSLCCLPPFSFLPPLLSPGLSWTDLHRCASGSTAGGSLGDADLLSPFVCAHSYSPGTNASLSVCYQRRNGHYNILTQPSEGERSLETSHIFETPPQHSDTNS